MGWFDQTGQTAYYSGLARTRQAHDDKNLTDVNVKRYISGGGYRTGSAYTFCKFTRIGGVIFAVEPGCRIVSVHLPDIAAGELNSVAVVDCHMVTKLRALESTIVRTTDQRALSGLMNYPD